MHLESRPRPQACEKRNLRLTDQLLHADLFGFVVFDVERQPGPRLPLLGARRDHPIVETGNPDVSILVFQRANDFCDRLHRVRGGAAVHSRMQVMVGALHMNLAVDNSAKTHAQGGQARREHLGVADHGRVALQASGIGLDERLDDIAADLLLAFDHELHVDRELAVLAQEPLDRLDQNDDLSLIVGGAARVNVVAANFRFERSGFPFIQWVRRLHVIVAVAEHRRLASCLQPLGIHQRIPVAFDKLRVRDAGLDYGVTDPFRRATDIRGVVGVRADAGNTQERFQFF